MEFKLIKNFSQGGIKLTNVDLDVAIEKVKGFFVKKEQLVILIIVEQEIFNKLKMVLEIKIK